MMSPALSIFSGTGHWNGPAVNPGGNAHAIFVGSPASPAYCQ